MMTVTTAEKRDTTLEVAKRRKQTYERILKRKPSAQRKQLRRQQPKQPRKQSGGSSARTVERKDTLKKIVMEKIRSWNKR